MTDAYIDRLAADGVLAEAEQVWDALDRGDDPSVNPIDVDDLLRQIDTHAG